MKIGDKVRFVNEVGGGRISGFEGKDIVVVEDADGFGIPMLRTEVVVIGDDVDELNFRHPSPKPREAVNEEAVDASAQGDSRAPSKPRPQEHGDSPAPMRPRPREERAGGNELNVYLGFIASGLGTETFRSYLVNDSNHYIEALLLSYENASCRCRFKATLEPNTKRMVEEFSLSRLGEMERLRVQLLAYKTDKPFAPQPAVSVDLRLDGVKFYKPHTFLPTPFFKAPALLLDVVRAGRERPR